MDRIAAISGKSARFCLLAIVFSIPLFFNPLSNLVFEIDKIILFRILTELALFFYLVKILLSGKIILPKFPYLYLAVLLIFLSQISAHFFSAYGNTSIWGNYWRGFGVFTHLHVFIFALLACFELTIDKKLLSLISISAFITSIYGLAQIIGLDFLNSAATPTSLNLRAMSTLGQPNYLGGYLLLALPASLYLFFLVKGDFRKIVIIAVISAEIAALIATYSRAAWLGFLFFVFLLAVYYRQKFLNKRMATFLLAIFIVIGSAFSFLSWRQLKSNDASELTIIGRVKSMAELKQGSVGIRLNIYRAAAEIIKEKPMLGHGLDAQIFYFAHYYRPDYAVLEKINTYPDRAHNEFLDILITTGFFGLAAWFFLIGVFLGELREKGRLLTEENKAYFLAFGLGGLAVYLMFSFFTIVIAVYFWLYFVLILKLNHKEELKAEVELKYPIKISAILVLFIFFLYSAYNFNIRYGLADYYHNRARIAGIKGRLSESFSNYTKAIQFSPKESFYPTMMVAQLYPQVSALANKELKTSILLDLEAGLEKIGYGKLTFEGKAGLAIIKGALEKNEEAGGIFKSLTEEYPGFARLYFDWGNIYFNNKKYKEALGKYFTALTLYPDLRDSNLNEEHKGEIIEEMLMVYKEIIYSEIKTKNWPLAKKYNDTALKLSPFDLELHLQRNEILFALGKKETLISSLDHDLILFPQNAEILKEQKAFSNH